MGCPKNSVGQKMCLTWLEERPIGIEDYIVEYHLIHKYKRLLKI